MGIKGKLVPRRHPACTAGDTSAGWQLLAWEPATGRDGTRRVPPPGSRPRAPHRPTGNGPPAPPADPQPPPCPTGRGADGRAPRRPPPPSQPDPGPEPGTTGGGGADLAGAPGRCPVAWRRERGRPAVPPLPKLPPRERGLRRSPLPSLPFPFPRRAPLAAPGARQVEAGRPRYRARRGAPRRVGAPGPRARRGCLPSGAASRPRGSAGDSPVALLGAG